MHMRVVKMKQAVPFLVAEEKLPITSDHNSHVDHEYVATAKDV